MFTTVRPQTTLPDPAPPAESKDLCCPEFDPAPWDAVVRVWINKLFVRAKVPQVMHVPIGMSALMTRLMRQIERAGAMPPAADALVLMQEISPWRSDVLIAVTREVPGLSSELVSGTFYSKVFDGPYRETLDWIVETDRDLAARGKRALRHLVRYAYCPRCARKYGHNPGVVFAEIT
jgi:hypothetical protein